MSTDPHSLLRHVFGFPAFRGLQEQVVEHLMAGQDALVLMPTGGGKSLCYQIPAMARPGTGIVISPLIALMQDQVGALQRMGVRAECLNSSQERDDARAVWRSLYRGELDLLYVSPERAVLDGFLEALGNIRLSLIAIDEAHCVSQWGHDFRPEYLGLNVLHERYPDVPRVALTATADEPTRKDILHRLRLDDARLFISGFDRPNIRYVVTPKSNARQQFLRFYRDEHRGDAGIVYCQTRAKVDKTAEWLKAEGLDALPYHAGMAAEDRARNQDRFLKDEGVVMVATVAFGMGIDKSNVRFVAHLDMPKSVEGYYQETGRAGRDGEKATAWMAYGLSDVMGILQLMANSQAEERHRRLERRKLDAMLGYCETTTCRRQVLLRYFGEEYMGFPGGAREGWCGNCDTCCDPVTTWDGTTAAQKALSCVFRTGQRFGVGHLVDVLLGRANDRIRNLGHDRLTTYGIGKDHSADEWSSVFRQLAAAGLVEVDMEGYGGLRLTAASRPVLKGETTVHLRRDPLPRKAGRKAAPAALPPAERGTLFEALRSRRLQLAREEGVPPYLIFHDSTLLAMVQRKPRTLADLGEVPGVGDRKLERYGQAFLEILEREVPVPT